MSDEEEDYMSDAILKGCEDVKPGLYKSSKEAQRRIQQAKQEENRKKRQKPLKVCLFIMLSSLCCVKLKKCLRFNNM